MRLTARKMFPVGLGLGLILAGLGAVALWIHERPDTSSAFTALALNQSVDPAQRVTPEDIAALKAELAGLKAGKEGLERLSDEMKSELTALRSQLTRVDRNQESIGREINQIAAAGLTGGKEADALALTPEEEQERAEAQTQAQVELVEGTLRAEKTDLQWASAAKLTLSEVFHSEAMTGMQLVEADCRTTLCRLELVLDDSTSLEDGFRKLEHLAPWQGQAFTRIDEGGSAVVYLAREGHSLPQSSE